MPVYAFLALCAGTWLGYTLQKPWLHMFSLDIATLYYILPKDRFERTYLITEELYDFMKEVHFIEPPHYEYLDSLQQFHDQAQNALLKEIKENLAMFGKHILDIWFLLVVFIVLFLPVIVFLLGSMIVAFAAPIALHLAKDYKDKIYRGLVCFRLAILAYRYTYNRNIRKTYKTKARRRAHIVS